MPIILKKFEIIANPRNLYKVLICKYNYAWHYPSLLIQFKILQVAFSLPSGSILFIVDSSS